MNNPNAKKTLISPRVLTAFVGIPVVLAIVHLGGWVLYVTVFSLAVLSMLELIKATRKSSTRVEALGVAALLLLLPSTYETAATKGFLAGFPFQLSFIHNFYFLFLLAFIIVIFCYNKKVSVSLVSLALTTFATIYLSLFAFLPAVQSLPNGRTLLWLTLFCVWTGDTLAYYGGRRFGKTKLTPLSPGKSREGALCGLVGSLVVGALIGSFTAIGTAHGLILGAFVGVFAPLGDLAESFWKRELRVKDLGTILPGHGGVLDRCDSLLFAAPTVYFVAKLLGV
jgi:phosphatidate cytidylyltransferase